MTSSLAVLGNLSDDDLDGRLERLVRGERQVSVIFLAHLGEFDRRRAHEARSFPSLFEYCTRRLGLSEAEAYLRIRAARVARDFPEVMGMLAAGQIQLSALARLSAHLTPANAAELLAKARGMTRREVERLALTFETCAPKADIVRALPSLIRAATPGNPMLDPQQEPPRASGPTQPTGRPEAPGEAAPLGPERPPLGLEQPADGGNRDEGRLVRISFTATEELMGRIERARALLRHKHPAGRLEHVIGAAIEHLLDARDPERRSAFQTAAREARRKKAQRRPADERSQTHETRASRCIPRRVRDEVWRRDAGRCTFDGPDGRRCGTKEWLEFDHIRPWAMGGRSDDAENIRLLCRAHNQHAARRVFGPWKP